MSQDNNVVLLNHKKRKNIITDRERVVFGYHYFEQNNQDEAVKILSEVTPGYYQSQFHKDISRALLCHATIKSTNDPKLGKESEFYLVVYRLTKHVTSRKLTFNQSGHFYQLKDELFKDFGL